MPVDRLSVIAWTPVSLPPASPAGQWAVVDASGSGEALSAALSAPRLTPLEALPEDCSDVVVLLESEDSDAIPDAVSARINLALAITQQVLARPGVTRLWWVTRSGQAVTSEEAPVLSQAALWGMGRTVDRECGSLTCVLIDLPVVRAVDEIEQLCAVLWAPPAERELALRGGHWQVPRLSEALLRERRPIAIHQATPGDLTSLKPRALRRAAPGPGQVEIAVHAAGLNFRDVLGALGLYPGEVSGLGGECAGEVVAVGAGVTRWSLGDRVIAMAPSFCTHTLADARHLAPWPQRLSAEEAATLPIAFLTAWHGLITLGELKAGERVLIHSAAGGVGLAAVQIANEVGAIIHATASRPKWSQLKAMGIPHIHSSRDLSFADEIAAVTDGAGVDVVLNALTGDFLDRSLDLLAPGGRFVEMGKRDIRDPATLPDGIAYHPFDLHQISVESPDQLAALFARLSQTLLDGSLQPILHHTFPLSAIQDAFRWMSQARHIGKIALRVAPVVPEPVGAVVITGGLGALGLVVARWLVEERGCQHLLLLSRSGLKSESTAAVVVEDLRQQGARIDVPEVDVCDEAALARLIDGITGPLQGVIHAAGVVDDGLIADLTPERVERVLSPKVRGAWNLHRATRGRALSFFALFSSAASLLGSASQASYAAANGFLDGLAIWRQAQGLPAVSIGWGPWSEGGMAARLGEAQQRRLRQTGILPITPRQGATMFGAALAQDAAVVGAMRWDRARLRVAMPPQVAPPLLLGLIGVAASAPSAPVTDLPDRLAALPTDQRPALLSSALQGVVAGVLGATDSTTISLTRSFQDTGFDSLMAVELRNRLRTLLDCELSATLAFDYPDITRLTAYLLELLDLGEVVEETERTTTTSWAEPIAVIGMACRFPGAPDPASLWDLLSAGGNAITDIPPSRWDIDAWYDPDPDKLGKMYARRGGFLDDIERFEPEFFGIAPREAPGMDPQQRLLLEVGFEALSSAEIATTQLTETLTGVYIGICSNEYSQRALASADRIAPDTMTGLAHSVAVGRLSYWMGLQGPNLAVDTACSSSLVSVHLGCQSLRSGECDVALAGGVNVTLLPETTVGFCRLRALSPVGQCQAFSSSADGYVRSEGCGVVVLKRLSDAEAAGDTILGIIRGSAVNQDGRSNGITAPNGPAQQRVIRAALLQAELEPHHIDYVEAHGTGTPLGDPIEVQALAEVMKQRERPLFIGSVKSNIGHAEGAAGIAGLIKILLAFQKPDLPMTLHAQELNPRISWDEIPVTVLQEKAPWPDTGRPRRAGVSSFGFSGTNAHIVLEQHSTFKQQTPSGDHEAASAVLAISAHSPAALRDTAAAVARHLDTHPDAVFDTARALALRPTLPFRGAVSAAPQSAADALRGLAVSEESVSSPRIGFAFSGQGSQWVGMGASLYESSAVFRSVVDICSGHLGYSVVEVWRGSLGVLSETRWTQPALF
ncbi:MAG: NADPH:quinone reductase-like Zn-dependent oxidoreductase/3-oxoacyl-(acyl-carrier-protein) synthase, partial [Myxococcota bacterium]